MSSQSGGAAAEFASVRKWAKYASVASTHIFCPVACETMGPINLEGLALIRELGARLSAVTGDPRECAFLLQRISIVIQRSNAVAFRGSFVGEGFYDI